MRSKPRYLDYNRPVAVCSTCFTLGKWHCYECGRDFCVEHFHVHECITNDNAGRADNSNNRHSNRNRN